MSLEATDLTAGYPSTVVLRDVSLVVPPGTVVALLGPNGAGKTTVLRTIAGLLKPSRGHVVVDGEDVTARPSHRIAASGICLVPEGRAIFPSLPVRDNLALFAGGASPAVIDASVHAFPALERKLDQIAGTLSGGEQQMVALCRAFLSGPKYVLLDEVSLGLAPMIVDEIFASLHALSESGTAMLVVEQYVHKALAFADLVYVLNKGEVAFAGEASELDADALAETYLGAGQSPANMEIK